MDVKVFEEHSKNGGEVEYFRLCALGFANGTLRLTLAAIDESGKLKRQFAFFSRLFIMTILLTLKKTFGFPQLVPTVIEFQNADSGQNSSQSMVQSIRWRFTQTLTLNIQVRFHSEHSSLPYISPTLVMKFNQSSSTRFLESSRIISKVYPLLPTTKKLSHPIRSSS
jgi:hypothetical protein